MSINATLQNEFNLQNRQTEQVISLIDSGNTIPFIARYRKEATGNLDDQVLRKFYDRLLSLRTLQEKKESTKHLLTDQGNLTDELAAQINKAGTITEVDDLYRPFRPKRKTRASIARGKGLEPLAELLISPGCDVQVLKQMVNKLLDPQKDLSDAAAVLAGARDILAERAADDAWLRRRLRRLLQVEGRIECQARTDEESVYRGYYDYSEPVSKIPGHRILAINRGEREKILSVKIAVNPAGPVALILSFLGQGSDAARDHLDQVAVDAWKRLLLPSLENEVRKSLTEQAENSAIDVFAANLRSLLMQPPIRGRNVLGVDPGYRTGCKLAAIDHTGKVLETGVIYPTPPNSRLEQAAKTVLDLLGKHQIQIIAIGNGTASRETEQFIAGLVKAHKPDVRWMVVSEAGASVYSASPLAAAEFPEFDVSLRSAVSIARRLQDPLAELVKIEPRSIGVGQYQHDLAAGKLNAALGGVVESCVNEVGVDLNTASPALLSYVSGLNLTLAGNIVQWREKNGAFGSRQDLLAVPRMGPRSFEQCAGFLRIPESAEILDNTSVHPESYSKVYMLSDMLSLPPSPQLAAAAGKIAVEKLASDLEIGIPTLEDIIAALSKPGRDPRDDLPQPVLIADIKELEDLRPGMTLQGVVRNVADFGAFVDIGVHQDGLVHISELADRYVRNPMDIVSVGQQVEVRILKVDVDRKRISLSMKQPGDRQREMNQ